MRLPIITRRSVLAIAAATFTPGLSVAQTPEPAGDRSLNTHPDLAACLSHLQERRWRALSSVLASNTPDSACVLLNEMCDQAEVDTDLDGLDATPMGGTIAGALLVEWGWRYRGTGFANTVTEEMAGALATRLTRARQYLTAAITTDANNGVAYNFLFTALKGMSEVQALQESWSSFASAERRPIRAYTSFASALQPRWFGSEELMVAFARTQQHALEPVSNALIAYVANDHILTRWRRSAEEALNFASQPGVLGEVGAANDAFSAGGVDRDLYRARFAHGHFSFFFWCVGLHDLARPHLVALGDYVPAPWSDLADPLGRLVLARRMAGIDAT